MELIEDLEQQQLPIRSQPKYRLGRIINKYLIIDIYSIAYQTREEAMYKLFRHNRSSRNFLIELYKYLLKSKFLKIEYY